MSDDRKPVGSGASSSGGVTRRQVIRSGMGLAGLLASARPSLGASIAGSAGHPPARAKNLIYVFLEGGTSQLDLFDPKPALVKLDGEPCPAELYEGKRLAFIRKRPAVFASPYEFKPRGESGTEISTLLPHTASIVDEIALIRSMHCDEFNHGPAQLQLLTGIGRFGRPSLGAWLDYAISTANPDLPGFISLRGQGMLPAAGLALQGSGMLPGEHQGVSFGSGSSPVWYLATPSGMPQSIQADDVSAINALNGISAQRDGNGDARVRAEQYDLALRMQESVPEAVDLEQESDKVLEAYGASLQQPRSFANQCLVARRLVERGVRTVQVVQTGWDHHSALLTNLPSSAQTVDRACAALVGDLKERGMLDETLVVVATEFGRTPIAQGVNTAGVATKNIGRDHQRDAFSVWLAGAGVRPGIVHGRTDDLGHKVVEDPVHVHDLNATILHLMGLDHERVTFRYEGRNHRLTDVHGQVVHGILA